MTQQSQVLASCRAAVLKSSTSLTVRGKCASPTAASPRCHPSLNAHSILSGSQVLCRLPIRTRLRYGERGGPARADSIGGQEWDAARNHFTSPFGLRLRDGIHRYCQRHDDAVGLQVRSHGPSASRILQPVLDTCFCLSSPPSRSNRGAWVPANRVDTWRTVLGCRRNFERALRISRLWDHWLLWDQHYGCGLDIQAHISR